MVSLLAWDMGKGLLLQVRGARRRREPRRRWLLYVPDVNVAGVDEPPRICLAAAALGALERLVAKLG